MRLPRSVVPHLLALAPEYSPCVAEDGSVVVRIRKAINGLSESSLQWHEHLTATLRSLGYTKLSYDRSVFILRDHAGKTRSLLCVHVDDLLVVDFENTCRERLLATLTAAYGKVSASRDASFTYLGVHIVSRGPQICLNQRLLIDAIDYVSPPRASSLPADRGILDTSPCAGATDPARFRSVLMRVLYIATKTRFDVLFPVCILAGRQQSSSLRDEAHLARLVRYLKRTADWCYTICPDSLTLTAAADASHACHPNGRGHTGFACFLGGSCIFARSVKQSLVSKSSAEAELLALNQAADEVLYLRNLLDELGAPQPMPTVIHQDNVSTILMMNKGELGTKRTKHFTVRHYFAKDAIDSGHITLKYEPGARILADGLTKPLPGRSGTGWARTLLGLQAMPFAAADSLA
jgi:hypothetical protein